ncbi:MAG: hypothetical protein HY226_04555 [Candidatus Vogelbacteria bacterium]|nr:hypothetical protein [Candidatus Vogelbacteria bacterium]
MDYSPQELNEVFKGLPQTLKEAVTSVETAETINNIGRKYGLHIDQIGVLGIESGKILLGLAHPTEFVSNITKKLGIERVVASQIASEINDKVFLRVRELLKGISDKPVKEQDTTDNEPHPVRDALLKAIENPEGIAKKTETPKPKEIPLVEIKNPYEPARPETPPIAPIPKIPPTAAQEPTEAPSILEQKMSGEVSLPKTERKVDMYREQV